MDVNFPKSFSLNDKKDWFNKRIVSSTNRLIRLKELNAPQEIIDGELNSIARWQKNLDELNR